MNAKNIFGNDNSTKVIVHDFIIETISRKYTQTLYQKYSVNRRHDIFCLEIKWILSLHNKMSIDSFIHGKENNCLFNN